jgi:hypothetical protein
MGMFDYINFKANCPECGTEITNWQSKNGKCALEVLEPWQVKVFHALCNNCKTFIYAKVDSEVEYIVKKCDITLSVDP